MLKIIFVCALLFISIVHAKQCQDCIAYTKCPKANEQARRQENAETFKSSFCGFDTSQNGKTPKVCCSAFDSVATVATLTRVNTETHPNVRLLPDDCGDITGKRIVGGTVANLYEFPWMALISYKTRFGLQFNCGGSVINSRYILTAAHCVQDKQIAGVRVGEHDLRYSTDCEGVGTNYVCESHLQDIEVEEATVHEGYVGLPIVFNDIALLRLSKPVDFSYKNAKPICLPVTNSMQNMPLGGRKATVAGWGLTEKNTDSAVLLKVDIPILKGDDCRKKYNKGSTKDKTENQLCAGELKKDSCNGDSGGPLMLETELQGAIRTAQYGIVSHGPKQCGSDYPGIYTDVTKFMGWILDHIRE